MHRTRPAAAEIARAVAVLCGAGLALACQPSSEPSTVPPPEPAPDQQEGPGAIPWAEGEQPEDASASAREVGDQPGSAHDPMTVDDPGDGIVTSNPSARCAGKAPPALRADVQVRAKEVQSCGGELPADKDHISGALRFTLRVGMDGQVEAVDVLSDTLKEQSVMACAKKVLAQPFEVAPVGGCALFIVPLTIEAERKQVPAD